MNPVIVQIGKIAWLHLHDAGFVGTQNARITVLRELPTRFPKKSLRRWGSESQGRISCKRANL